MRCLRLIFIVCCVLLGSESQAFNSHIKLFEQKDIHEVMSEILSRHVEHKRINASLLQLAIQNYIDAFDPRRVYLLRSEVTPFIEAPPAKYNKWVHDYEEGNYQVFWELNNVIQDAILRQRDVRAEVKLDLLPKLAEMKASVETAMDYSYEEKLADFVEEPSGLKGRYEELIKEQVQLGGFDWDYMIARQKEHEADFLFVDEKNRILPKREQEHLITVRILKALALSLDAHTAFYSPEEAYEMRVSLEKEFVGVGIVFNQTKEGVLVQRVLPQSPAELSGKIEAGDVLVEIDGQFITDTNLQETLDKMRGPIGSQVVLTIKKPKGDQIDVILTRARVEVSEDRLEVDFETQPDGGVIGKIALHAFYESDDGPSSEKDIIEALYWLREKGPINGLVLDLRDNMGGFLSQAVKVAGLFISNGVIVVTKHSDGEKYYFRDLDSTRWYKGPLVILTSKISASAAEVVAQALQDYGTAIVVGGKHTYGKGSIQLQNITEGHTDSFYKVTVGRYYTVSGRTTQLDGVNIDIVLPGLYDKQEIGESLLKNPLTKDKVEPAFVDFLPDVRPVDRLWFLLYYLPTIQQPVKYWHNHLPQLRAKSAQRVSKWHELDDFEEKKKQIMVEAVDIVKDMIELEKNDPMPEEENPAGLTSGNFNPPDPKEKEPEPAAH